MKYPNIVAISGLKNSGKDTASYMMQYLLNTPKWMHKYWLYNISKKFFRNPYKITSFAHPLKKTLSALLEIPLEKFNDRSFKENYYIYFPTLEIINNAPKEKTLSDNKFSKMLATKDFSFLQNYWITIRQLLQAFGTDCMRNFFGNRLWILLTLKNKKCVIISDLRFNVELEAVKNFNGIVIYIKRDTCKAGNHASEKEVSAMLKLNKFDYVVENNKSLKDLFNSLKKII